MKKEDITIELTSTVMSEISNVCYSYDLDLEHIPFSKFKIREVHENTEEYFNNGLVDTCKKIIEKEGLLQSLSDSDFNEMVKSVKDNISSGIETSVEIVGRTIHINAEMGKIDLIFNEGIKNASITKEKCYDIKYFAKDKRFEKYVNETDRGQTHFARTMLEVVGILTYLQIPNKSKEVQKTSRIDVESKKSKKKKSSKQSKTYIYKTTYRIDSIADNINFGERRGYERKTEEWTARGHWRTLRNGRKIWIKESVRKSKIPVSNNSENTAKEYKITKVDL